MWVRLVGLGYVPDKVTALSVELGKVSPATYSCVRCIDIDRVG